MSASSRKGQTFERLIADHLRDRLDDRIDIRPKNGRNDRGDLGGIRLPLGGRVVAELKNHNRLELGQWLKEAEVEKANDDAEIGIVIHKRKGHGKAGEQYVTMTLDSLALLLGGIG